MDGKIETVADLNRIHRAFWDARSREIAGHIANPIIAKLAYEQELEKCELLQTARSEAERISMLRGQRNFESEVEKIVRKRAAFRLELSLERDGTAAIASPTSNEMGMFATYRATQRTKAGKLRVKLEDGRTLHEVIMSLVLSPDCRDLKPADLWQRFWATLEDLGLDPEEIPGPAKGQTRAYRYDFGDKRREISHSRFCDIVRDVRRGKPH